MVTIKDIAHVTGLSTATVARALSGSGPTRPATRERVFEAADQLGYVVSSAARSMRNQSSEMVGLIVPDINIQFYAQVARAMANACDEHGLQLLLSVTAGDVERELRQVRAMVAARCAAIALVPVSRSSPHLAPLLRRQPFAQLVDRTSSLDADWFGFDDRRGIEAATTHLLDLGHRHIMLICSSSVYSTGTARSSGFRAAFAKRGLAVDEALVRTGNPTAEHGRTAMADLPAHVTAVLAAGSLPTEGAVEAVQARGLSVPRDLSFVGFGAEKWLRWWHGGMTRVVPPVDVVAEACAQHLLTRIREDAVQTSHGPREFLYKSALVIGETTQSVSS